jgi:multiple sugar transport system permease protein
MAAGTLFTLPMIVVFFIGQRQFIEGITLTGIKG